MAAGLSAAQVLATLTAYNQWNTAQPSAAMLVSALTTKVQELIDMGFVLHEVSNIKMDYKHINRGVITGTFGGKAIVVRLYSFRQGCIMHAFLAGGPTFFEIMLDRTTKWAETFRFSDPLTALLTETEEGK